jgi:hypothetical protein
VSPSAVHVCIPEVNPPVTLSEPLGGRSMLGEDPGDHLKFYRETGPGADKAGGRNVKIGTEIIGVKSGAGLSGRGWG